MEVTTPPVQTTFGTEHVIFFNKIFKFTAVGATGMKYNQEKYIDILYITSSGCRGRGIYGKII